MTAAEPKPSTVEKLLSSAREAARLSAAKNRESYRKLVAQAANSADLSANDVLAKLETFGVPLDKFETDVAMTVKRLLWRAEYLQAEELARKITAAEAKVAEANAVWQQAVDLAHQQLAATVGPLEREIGSLKLAADRAEQARAQLAKTAPAERVATRDAAQSRLAAATRHVETLQAQLHEGRGRLAQAEKVLAELLQTNPIAHFLKEGNQQQYWLDDHSKNVAAERGVVERLKASLAELEAVKIPEAHAAVDAARTELAQAEAALLVP